MPKLREVADRSLIIFRASHIGDESIGIHNWSKFNLVLYYSIMANNDEEESHSKMPMLMHNDNLAHGQRFSSRPSDIVGFKRFYL